jgi:hypothetical protein
MVLEYSQAMRIGYLSFAMLAACTAGPVTGPDTVTPPTTFTEVAAQAPPLTAPDSGEAVELDACAYGRWQKPLGLGSAWALVHPTTDDRCEIWLGGETEDPRYDGSPTEYCLFDRHGSIAVTYGDGGPASITSAFCRFAATAG